MKNRRSFLTAVASSGVSFALLSKAAQGQSAPSATPGPKPSSAVALAVAGTFRTFDPALDDATIEAIARGIDQNRTAGLTLNPKKKRLANSDEMVARFAATEKVSS